MSTVPIEHVQQHLAELIQDASHGGEVVITEGGRPLACLTAPPMEGGVKDLSPLFGLLNGKMQIMSNFDEPLNEF